MRIRSSVAVLLAASLAAVAGCGGDGPGQAEAVPGRPGARKTSAALRSLRRAFDGAPPVIPHAPFQGECTACHDELGLAVAGTGFAPPMPHALTPGLSSLSRCTQCHVYRTTEALFVASAFEGLPQDLRPGARAYEGAPPVMPHDTFLRENCRACHAGPAAREALRTSHPERENCVQCHVPRRAATAFVR